MNYHWSRVKRVVAVLRPLEYILDVVAQVSDCTFALLYIYEGQDQNDQFQHKGHYAYNGGETTES